jgi:hypothetical protein
MISVNVLIFLKKKKIFVTFLQNLDNPYRTNNKNFMEWNI